MTCFSRMAILLEKPVLVIGYPWLCMGIYYFVKTVKDNDPSLRIPIVIWSAVIVALLMTLFVISSQIRPGMDLEPWLMEVLTQATGRTGHQSSIGDTSLQEGETQVDPQSTPQWTDMEDRRKFAQEMADDTIPEKKKKLKKKWTADSGRYTLGKLIRDIGKELHQVYVRLKIAINRLYIGVIGYYKLVLLIPQYMSTIKRAYGVKRTSQNMAPLKDLQEPM